MHIVTMSNQGDTMKALHMLGEVILGLEDFNTVGAVVEVGLGMVIVLVIRSRSRKYFFL